MSTTSQIADALEKSGIPFTRVEGVANGIEYWGLSVRHENVHAEVRECSDWVEMKAWHYTPEQFMDMLVGAGTCHNISKVTDTRERKVRFVCSECDAWIDSEFIWNHEYSNGESPWVKDCKLNYCPNCGRRIEEVSE